MHPFVLVHILAASTCCQAFAFPDVSSLNIFDRSIFSSREAQSGVDGAGKGGTKNGQKQAQGSGCPAVWFDISKDLTSRFLKKGVCTDDARAAIRSSFHDCFDGACDGSLVLGDECFRSSNNGLLDWSMKLRAIKEQYNVGMADLIQFAGAHATVTCPKGPVVPVFVGRKDSYTPSKEGWLPPANATGDALLKAFQSKGFTATDLAALIGAHTTAKQNFVNAQFAGYGQDSTPGIWDVNYYKETIDGAAPFSFPADKNLVKHPIVGPRFKEFVGKQQRWNTAYVAGFRKMSMLGVENIDELVDCTSALPRGTRKRDIKAAPIGAR
ncbi:heme peroxidase [Mytilinidion resinicola]|uniref:Peroxidase n=1 Tax=Mytilinidion resinicola TaxID=574789 RepID=A0A6A6YAP1_9PEZI|nr:heme peroxidase [Mytilinidion resinicola]KAF2805074.1 heme peroxidase [Mytilinidion resinicola]